ncbi:transketolase [Hydrocarboniphaga sp.]|uniref:transketolase n=1 Tax=Hydrocarboniphaga sp. TaxID=2033016 RepID=UPI003D0BCFCA
MPTRLELANAIRALSMDAVQKANSGHPGMPMGMADIAEVLWNDYLSHHPADPKWFNRDRFVVSNGHGSMLLYSLLHLSGYGLTIDDLKNFRQLHSKTPGHPEQYVTAGVETTTGPLGQGLANAVGMAIAESVLGWQFNRDGFPVVDHYTYVFAGDGCLMEGISHEACSLAGTLGLGKLIVFYDDNNISIDGEVHDWFADDTPGRFEAYGWQVVRKVNGHDPAEIKLAIETARASKDKPTLICCKTVIGFGSPNKAGKESSHGAPLGAEEIAKTREQLGWPHAPFEIPQDIRDGWNTMEKGATAQRVWNALFDRYAAEYPKEAAELRRRIAGKLPENWAETVAHLHSTFLAVDKPVATRKSSQNALNLIAPQLPEFLGGSADLTDSNLTRWEGALTSKPARVFGNYISYGVREFGMAAAMNGMLLHGGLIPFGGTFLVFSDYSRNAVRMAALMKIGVIHVFTHDSIGLGEDGPTHQPVEHVSALRLIPNLETWRPADAFETAIAWQAAVERRNGPTALALSRQNLPPQPHPAGQAEQILRGGYVVHEPLGSFEAVIIATGSEVSIAVDAAKKLADAGHAVRVVSMPCAERFLKQDAAYRTSVLPKGSKRLAVEAGVTQYWRGFVGDDGDVIGVDSFGESAPAPALFEHFGLTVSNIVSRVQALIG